MISDKLNNFLVYKAYNMWYNIVKIRKGQCTMTSTNMTGLRDNLPAYVNQAVEFSDVINVSTENGNAIIISEADYNALLETLYLSSDPKVRKEIIDGRNMPIDECIPENEVEW